MRKSFSIVLVLMCVVIGLGVRPALAQSIPLEKHSIEASLGMDIGNSDLYILPRGEGNHEKWQLLVDIRARQVHWFGGFNTQYVGGSIFDNPDRNQFEVYAGYTARNFSLFVRHRDQYALNAISVPDTHARRPGSGVNTFELVLRRDFPGQLINYAFEGAFVFAGDEPIAYGAYTTPYVNKRLAGEIHVHPRFCDIYGRAEVALRDDALQNHVTLTTHLEKTLYKSKLFDVIAGGRGTYHINTDVPNYAHTYRGFPLTNKGGAFFEIRLRFHN